MPNLEVMSGDAISVSYFNNKLDITHVPDNDKQKVKELWVKLREEYADWVADVRLTKIEKNNNLVEMLEWKGMSTWWINNLVRKDSEGDTQWLHRLMTMYLCNEFQSNVHVKTDDKILIKSLNLNFPEISACFIKKGQGGKYKIKTTFPSAIKYIRIFRSLYNSIERWLLVLWLTGRTKEESVVKKIIWFVTTYPANWVMSEKGNWYDRHLMHSPLRDRHHQLEAGYLVYILKYSKDSDVSFFKLRKQLRQLKKKSGRHTFYPESKLKANDIFEVYWSTFNELRKFNKWKKKTEFRNIFTISGMNLSMILIDHWEQTYFGLMQYCKLHGLATKRFLDVMEQQQIIVTYLELFVETRTDYHLNNRTKAIFYALQHAEESRNYGEAYNRKSEFINKEGIENIHTCPMPDFFLVHGQQYRNILSEFYPNNRIYTIGSLKVKHFMDTNRNRIQKSEIDQIIGDINRKVILVALSSNDARFVLSLLSQWNPKNDILIMVTVHFSSNINWIKHKISKDLSHLQVKLIMHVSTWELLPYADALVCGYSSLIYETLFNKIPAAVLQPLGVFSPREIDPRIPNFYDISHFDKWVSSIYTGDYVKKSNQYFEEFFVEYFYTADGQADERMWDVISLARK